MTPEDVFCPGIVTCQWASFADPSTMSFFVDRSPFAKSFFGLPLRFSFSSFVAKSLFMVFSLPSLRILSTGCVSFWPPTAEPSWSWVSLPSLRPAWSCRCSPVHDSLRYVVNIYLHRRHCRCVWVRSDFSPLSGRLQCPRGSELIQWSPKGSRYSYHHRRSRSLRRLWNVRRSRQYRSW